MRCGKVIRPEVEYRPRVLELEREFTREAARSAVDPTALIEFAEARAQAFPEYGATASVRVGRDWLREAREEAADMRNYLCWWLEENPGHEHAQDVLIALRFTCLAFDRLLPRD